MSNHTEITLSYNDSNPKVELARFKGRPGELSPKARFWMFAGWLLPSRFKSVVIPRILVIHNLIQRVHDSTEPPFDRHDWVVRRPQTGEEVRYVIDYYSVDPLPDGSPVFSLDVRPALDNVGSVKDRVLVATQEAWDSLRESRLQEALGGQRSRNDTV